MTDMPQRASPPRPRLSRGAGSSDSQRSLQETPHHTARSPRSLPGQSSGSQHGPARKWLRVRSCTAAQAGLARLGLATAVLALIAVSLWTRSSWQPLSLLSMGETKISQPGSSGGSLEDEFSNWYQNSSWFDSYEVDPARERMWRRWTTDYDQDAVCNDGTPGAFYVRRGQGQASNR